MLSVPNSLAGRNAARSLALLIINYLLIISSTFRFGSPLLIQKSVGIAIAVGKISK
jgi:hypothetical protein